MRVRTSNGIPEHPALDSAGNIYATAHYGGLSAITSMGGISWYQDLYLYGSRDSAVISEYDITFTLSMDENNNDMHL